MSKLFWLIGASLVVAAPAAVQAQQSQAVQTDPKQSDVNKIVCEREDELGSRLKGKKVCMTVQEWKAFRQQHREDVERVQQSAGTARSG